MIKAIIYKNIQFSLFFHPKHVKLKVASLDMPPEQPHRETLGDLVCMGGGGRTSTFFPRAVQLTKLLPRATLNSIKCQYLRVEVRPPFTGPRCGHKTSFSIIWSP